MSDQNIISQLSAHNRQVSELSARVADFHRTKTPFRIYHGNTNSTRPSSRTASNSLDVSRLNHVLAINPLTKTCVVEPNVSMDALVAATLSQNLVPPVVMEFPGITVGGAVTGTAGESSSFRHGFFDSIVNWMEVILGNGEVVRASKQENSDLFEGMKGTFGTLGVGVLFELKLIVARQFVELRYETITRGIAQAKAVIERDCERPEAEVSFVDGIMYDKANGVIMAGKMVDSNEDGLPVTRFDRPWDPWFYVHVESILRDALSVSKSSAATQPAGKQTAYRELIPLTSYLFRYDRGGFWTGRYAFSYFLTPFNQITRYLLDGFMHTRILYHAFHRSGLSQQYIIQDLGLPWDNTESFYDWVDQTYAIYPQWLCPLRKGDVSLNPHHGNAIKPENASEKIQDKLILNFGFWGPCPGPQVTVNRLIESKLRDFKGMKWLYAETFYTEEEFWGIYDQRPYDDLRAKYHAESLPNVYEKVGGTGMNRQKPFTGIWRYWPFPGIYGILSTIKGGDYLRKG